MVFTIETVEDSPIRSTCLSIFSELLLRSSRLKNKAIDKPKNYQQWLRDAGFKNVSMSKCLLPVNGWHPEPRFRDIGEMLHYNMEMYALEGLALNLFTQQLQWKYEQLQLLLAAVKNDLHNINAPAWWPLSVSRKFRERFSS